MEYERVIASIIHWSSLFLRNSDKKLILPYDCKNILHVTLKFMMRRQFWQLGNAGHLHSTCNRTTKQCRPNVTTITTLATDNNEGVSI